MQDSNGLLDSALSLYERNARIAEAFYRPLQALEVCLRNHLAAELRATYAAGWYRNGGPGFDAGTVAKIRKAEQDLLADRRIISVDSVTAELSFGFWVSILGRRYDASLWRTCFAKRFRNGGRGMARQDVHSRVDKIRRFRNRVFHHEPIYHLDPAQMHAEIIEAIGWMCPDSAAWALHHSRVDYVLENPWP